MGLAKVSKAAVDKSKERKAVAYQRTLQKANEERQGAELLRRNKIEALKAIATQYVATQQQAVQAQQEQIAKEKKETQKKVLIGVGVGVAVITIGVIAYKKYNN